MKPNLTLFLLAACTAGTMTAQQIASTMDLKRACETSPNHVVTVTSPLKIEFGARYPAVEQVDSGCTLVFQENTGIELKQVAVRFAGPLLLQSSRKAEVVLFDSYLEAASLHLPLYGRGSKVTAGQSRMVARAGNFTLGFFEDSSLDVFDAFGPLPGAPAIETAGMFSIFTDASTLSFKNARIQAGTGIDINLADELPTLKMEETDLRVSAGAIAIYGTLRDTKVEINKGAWSAPNGVRATLGRQSALVIKDTRIEGGSGPVNIGVGSYSSSAEVSQVTIDTAGSIALSAGSFWAAVIVDGATLRAAAGVAVTAGSQWSKAVAKNNTVTSGVSFSVAAGSNGTCEAGGNVVSSPVQRQCR